MEFLMSLVVAIGLSLSSIFTAPLTWFPHQGNSSPHTSTSAVTLESLNKSDSEYWYMPVLLLTTKTFLYKTRRGTEGLSHLMFLENESLSDLNVSVDDPSRSFIPSPNKEYILITQEQAGFIINTKTLDRQYLIELPENQKLGVYSDLPSFIPDSKWIDDTHVQFNIYSEGSSENTAPDKTQIVDITQMNQ